MLSGESSFFLDLLRPSYLGLLAVLPLVVLLSFRSLAALGTVRRIVAIAIRCAVMAILILALAGPEWVHTTDDQTVVFAIDESDSVPAERQTDAVTFMKEAVGKMRKDKDRVAMLSFAGRSSVEQLPRWEFIAEQMRGASETHRTDIAGALRLGLALFPSDTAKRLVVMSDGNETRGVAAHEAESYAALGIPIDVVPLHYDHAAEILVEQLSAPATAEKDEAVDLQFVVRSQTDTTARLKLYHNDHQVDLNPAEDASSVAITLKAGLNRFAIPVELHYSGVHRFRAMIEPDDARTDAVAVNNEGRAFTIVGKASRVIILTDTMGNDPHADEVSADLLEEALTAGGIECTKITVDDLPNDSTALADCSTLILSNVSAISLGPKHLDMLASFVRDQGGGLIAIGGDQAFSIGGYTDSPLEEILPVETSRDKLQMLSLSIVIVIDRSGSMDGEKLAMARQAAIGSVKLLSRLDQVGVIAFDGAPQWVVGLQSAQNGTAIQQQIASIGCGGGTNMFPAMEAARTALNGSRSHVRHMILLTDGQSMPGAFEQSAQACKQAGITISTIAVGPDADQALLARIAQLSGGRKYTASSAKPLPQIFARETILVSRGGVYEKPFTPRLRQLTDNRVVAGFVDSDFPSLKGHVVTEAKPMAQVALVRATKDGADPILAYWQVGLGRTVAFTSGLWPAWGPDWVSWPGFTKLWTQAVRYASSLGNPGDLELETAVDGSEAHISVSGEHLPIDVQGSLVVDAHVRGPDGELRPLKLRRTAAGHFETDCSIDEPGTYLVAIPYRCGGQQGILRTGLVQSYSPEHRLLRHDEVTLTELATRTGGRVLSLAKPDDVFDASSIRPLPVRQPFSEELLKLAILLFLFDVGIRRIAIGPADVAKRFRKFVHSLARPRSDADTEGTLEALQDVKARIQADKKHDPDVPEPPSSPIPSGWREVIAPSKKRSEQPLPERPPVAQPKPTPQPQKEGEDAPQVSTTARLLRAKRRVRQEEDE